MREAEDVMLPNPAVFLDRALADCVYIGLSARVGGEVFSKSLTCQFRGSGCGARCSHCFWFTQIKMGVFSAWKSRIKKCQISSFHDAPKDLKREMLAIVLGRRSLTPYHVLNKMLTCSHIHLFYYTSSLIFPNLTVTACGCNRAPEIMGNLWIPIAWQPHHIYATRGTT